MFFYSNKFLKIEDALVHLFTSRSTLSHDIKQLKNILDKWHVTLESKPNYGLYLQGEEFYLRSLILNEFPRLASSDDEKELQQTITRLAKQFHFTLHIGAAKEISHYIYIASNREKRGYHLKQVPYDTGQLCNEREYQPSAKLRKLLIKRGLKLSSTDVLFITLLFVKFRVTSVQNNILTEKEANLFSFIADLTNHLLSYLSLYATDEWKQNFTQHMLPSLKRARYGLIPQNELLEEIKKTISRIIRFGIASYDIFGGGIRGNIFRGRSWILNFAFSTITPVLTIRKDISRHRLQIGNRVRTDFKEESGPVIW
ncbi:helix-turn-helix domain-containing protein [Virgibacillus halophilus]|uniref:Helix-turn-helix domain-containing protein n=1 Tax=Tigheibacillus halophilus TaxID=361280 RepID=A0ABU5C2X0_9BACI|nr:helix-turn-helix domain-containing protein [Virgibacillus halophilus]